MGTSKDTLMRAGKPVPQLNMFQTILVFGRTMKKNEKKDKKSKKEKRGEKKKDRKSNSKRIMIWSEVRKCAKASRVGEHPLECDEGLAVTAHVHQQYKPVSARAVGPRCALHHDDFSSLRNALQEPQKCLPDWMEQGFLFWVIATLHILT